MTELSLYNLPSPPKGAKKSRKRIGRGNSGKSGTYSGRGLKGQKARSGVGGLKLKGMRQRLLTIPKLRGFKSPYNKPAVINVGELDSLFDAKAVITPKILVKKGIIGSPRFGVKILGKGNTKKAFTIRNCNLSKSAEEKIKKAGGTIE